MKKTNPKPSEGGTPVDTAYGYYPELDKIVMNLAPPQDMPEYESTSQRKRKDRKFGLALTILILLGAYLILTV